MQVQYRCPGVIRCKQFKEKIQKPKPLHVLVVFESRTQVSTLSCIRLPYQQGQELDQIPCTQLCNWCIYFGKSDLKLSRDQGSGNRKWGSGFGDRGLGIRDRTFKGNILKKYSQGRWNILKKIDFFL